MKWKTIVVWHIAALLSYALLVLLSEQIWPSLSLHRSFSLQVGLMFFAVCFLISMASWRLVTHKNPYYFSWVTMLSVLIKLIFGIGLVVIYTWYGNPANQLYAISFILSYLIFTVCEVYILQQIIYKAKRSWRK